MNVHDDFNYTKNPFDRVFNSTHESSRGLIFKIRRSLVFFFTREYSWGFKFEASMQFKRNKKLGVLRRPAHFFPNFLFVSSLDLQYNTVINTESILRAIYYTGVHYKIWYSWPVVSFA